MTSALDALITGQLFAFLMVFARLGSAMMIFPGFSDTTVPVDIRLYIALSMSLVMAPVVRGFLPAIPPDTISFVFIVCREVLAGIFIGLMSQIILNAINVTGNIISQMSSLSNGFVFNPQVAGQSPIIGGMLSLLAVVLLLETDLHHMLILGLMDSYQVFPADKPLLYGDIVDALSAALSNSFLIGVQIAAPFFIVGMSILVAMGLVARLVPQIQVFMLSVPIQIMVGLTLLTTSLSAMMLFFLEMYQDFWQNFL